MRGVEARKVYVGSTFSRYAEVRAVVDMITATGREVTHDWTRTRAFGTDGHPLPGTGGGYKLAPDDAAAHALDDLVAVASADLAIFLGDTPSCGWLVECGHAISQGLQVWVVAPFKWTVFWELPQVAVFDDLSGPLELLGCAWR